MRAGGKCSENDVKKVLIGDYSLFNAMMHFGLCNII